MANKEQRGNKDKNKQKAKKEKQNANAATAIKATQGLPEEITDLLQDARDEMRDHLTELQDALIPMQVGRIEPKIVEGVMLSKSSQTIGDIATVSVLSAHQLQIQAYDDETLAEMSEALQGKALSYLNLSINVNAQEHTMTLTFPKMTAEQRKSLLDTLHAKCEGCKIKMRNVRMKRGHELQTLSRQEQLSQDETNLAKNSLQRVVDDYVLKIGAAEKLKIQELSKS